MAESQIHFRDFTRKRKPIRFRVGDNEYSCRKTLPVEGIQDLVKAIRRPTEDADETNAFDRVKTAFKLILKPESYETFDVNVRVADDDDENDDAIDIEQLTEIIQWVLEVYTKRPTSRSSTSSDGSATADDGTSSTGGPSHNVSVLPTSYPEIS